MLPDEDDFDKPRQPRPMLHGWTNIGREPLSLRRERKRRHEQVRMILAMRRHHCGNRCYCQSGSEPVHAAPVAMTEATMPQPRASRGIAYVSWG